MQNSLILNWSGPYGWPSRRQPVRVPDFERGGVYLFAVEHVAAYLVYCAGHTQPFLKRFQQHDRLYRNGTYTIFDHDDFAAGVRRKVWPGFWTRRTRPAELEHDFTARAEEIRLATERWLAGYRVFVAQADVERRVRARLEAGLMAAFMKAPPPACDMPDRGMSLSSRWPSEAPIHVRNVSSHPILGLPDEMVV